MANWSRRAFIKVGGVGSLALRSISTLSVLSSSEEAQTAAPAVVTLDKQSQDVLLAAMDEIIPSSEGMPAASQAGVLEYLCKLTAQHKEIAAKLRESLTTLDELSNKNQNRSFLSLSDSERIQSLTALQENNPEAFRVLRDSVYEAYYVNPAIWKLVGYEFHATNMGGPKTKPFDERVLAEVRKRPKYYLEAN